ncbi:alpha/beta fold hydrolase [Granulicoccus phenolivorans]|uniref:alpha/beta fold hydrolase n=1 Tax=Granulicoccus phenolivorans TaxID=266854 RepID=UPI0004118F1E|nr:alpha/beta hydrolase [Granulicoccus phenolivorans]
MTEIRTVPVEPGAAVEVRTAGSGPPLLLIQTALAPEELVPLGAEPLIAERYRVIDCRRRGYGASSAATGPGSIPRDARDCLTVLTALGIDRAHVLGTSYSAAVALELAALEPARVRTLTLIEPPPRHGRSAETFLAANRDLRDCFARAGVTAALELFSQALGTRSWRAERAETAPDVVARIEADAVTFFTADLSALEAWTFDPARAAAVTAPVLYLAGAASPALFAPVRDWVRELFPDCAEHTVAGAGHDLPMSHPGAVAALLAAFLAAHPD